MSAAPVITIDGPSGSGKGTVSRLVADQLGWAFLDSGALYRLVGLAARRRGVALDDAAALANIARALDVRFVDEEVWLDGAEVGHELRSEASGAAASQVAALPAVREALVDRQRAFRAPPGLVADGRDMGTVIFPDAELKIFLTANAEERARRRYKQLKEKGLEADLAALVAEIAARDKRDSERAVAPLRPAEDAVVVDSSRLDIAQTVQEVLAAYRLRRGQ
ncbi:(d)CMP kinase [Ectothiorhodospiraceae bacterium 2226]|nr:(d)CMP kinase [Ectothiorhodospiraceae bacterium 2226]